MKRIIVGISGASGAIYGFRLLQELSKINDIESHLVVSPSARRTLKEETDLELSDLTDLADVVHNHKNIGASIASGSFITDGMIIAPCSIKTLSQIANSHNDDLISRAADVCLKEHRKLILLLRETPLHLGHIELMRDAARFGAIIMPPVPAFYNKPKSVDDIVLHTVGRLLDHFNISHNLVMRWEG